MLLDDIDDPLIQTAFQREVDAFLDMSNDDQRAHCRSQIVMRIVVTNNVFGKIIRLHELTDIVKVSTRTAHRAIGSNLVCGSFGEVRNDIAVMPGAGGFKAKTQ